MRVREMTLQRWLSACVNGSQAGADAFAVIGWVKIR